MQRNTKTQIRKQQPHRKTAKAKPRVPKKLPPSVLSEYGRQRIREEEKIHRRVMRNLSDPAKVAEYLREYNLWRRGEGRYSWKEHAEDVPFPPFAPKTLGHIIDRAVELLFSS